MRKLTAYLLWLYVFTVSWDTVELPFFGSLSRAVGLVVVGVAILTTVLRGRFRKPDAVLGFAVAFGVFSMLSLLWTISYQETVTRTFTYAQLVASAWLIRESVRTTEQVEPLMTAYCYGSFVPLISLAQNFAAGVQIGGASRFSANDLNPNQFGIQLMIGLPMAWHFITHRRGLARAVAIIYFAVTPLGLLLTATRGGFVAGIVAAAVVPLTLPRQSLRMYILSGVLLIVAVISITLLVPRANLERILTISNELTTGGRLSGRTDIWKAGLQVYPEHPFLGVGAGGYGVAVEPHIHFGRAVVSHNTVIGLLIEEGIVGLSMFAAALGACAWTIFRLPPPYRAVWSVLMLTWLVGAMDGNFEHVKITWVLFGLVSAQSGLTAVLMESLGTRQRNAITPVISKFPHPAHLSRT